MPNIPARYTPPVGSYYSSVIRDDSPSANPSSNEVIAGLRRPSSGVISAKRPATPSVENPIVDLDDLPAEDKARVLRRHLLMHGERRPSRTDLRALDGSSDQEPDADEPSVGPSTPLRSPREISETFPIPYHAPGADVT